MLGLVLSFVSRAQDARLQGRPVEPQAYHLSLLKMLDGHKVTLKYRLSSSEEMIGLLIDLSGLDRIVIRHGKTHEVISSKRSQGAGSLLLGPYETNDLAIELYGESVGEKNITQVYSWKRKLTGFGTSLECHINSICDERLDDQKRSSCRIMMVMEEGIVTCSGALVNNTEEDQKAYVLSAYHCEDGFTPRYEDWRFDFLYASDSCESPMEEPEPISLMSCTKRAGHPDSDFLLVEISEPIPGDAGLYFSGWDRRDLYFPDATGLIHHPSGDIRKVSFAADSVQLITQSLDWENDVTTPPNSHIRNRMNEGTQEPGSSGSPLYDADGHIIGQLHGGTSECTFFTSVGRYGRLHTSWDVRAAKDSQLLHWLDPVGLDTSVWDGAYQRPPDSAAISGTVLDFIDRPVALVEVFLLDGLDTIMQTETNKEGKFRFDRVEEGRSYTLFLRKLINPLNGISTIDLIRIQQHLLGLRVIEEQHLLDAADFNGSQSITAFDLVSMRLALLGRPTAGLRDSWILYPRILELDRLDESILDLEFRAQKTGDLDYSADPCQ